MTVAPAQLRRVFQENLPPADARADSSFGKMWITRVDFEPRSDTRSPTPQAAAFFRLLALFAIAGRYLHINWFPEDDEAWNTSPAVRAAATLPLLDFGDSFGFSEREFVSLTGWDQPTPSVV